MATRSNFVCGHLALLVGMLLFSTALDARAVPRRAGGGAPGARKVFDYSACYSKCGDERRKGLVACETPTCEEDVNAKDRRCRQACSMKWEASTSTGQHENHVLEVKHHPQATPVWCWAAAIAMTVEFLQKKEVTDCQVASKMDRLTGGDGFCCDSRGFLLKSQCFRGSHTGDMTTVMRAFGVPMNQFDRPLTWDEVRSSIDHGYPVMIGRTFEWGGGHAEVIVGYRAPSTLLIDDPWIDRDGRLAEESYLALAGNGTMADAWRNFHGWRVSWVFDPDLTGIPAPLDRAKASQAPVEALSQKPLSSMRVAFPEMNEPAKSKSEKRAAQLEKAVRVCYDNALLKGDELPPRTSVAMTLALEKGTPSFIMLKESGGLPRLVTDCMTEAMAKRWLDVFPAQGAGDSQKVVLSFERTAAAPAVVQTRD